MSIAVDTVWELRVAGAATNGGGFKDLNPGTSVDYSQQDAAQLSLTDIASNGAGTGIYSATGGFTAAMEGNCMYISGTGFTTGWYQIVGYTDANNITIDRSCGVSASGGTGNVGGAWQPNYTDWNLFFNTTNKSNYNISYIKAGTYDTVIQGGSALNIAAGYNQLLGYNTTRDDSPEGTARPFLDFGNTAGYLWYTGAVGVLANIRIDKTYTGNNSNSLYVTGLGDIVRNCKITRSGYTNAYAVRIGIGDVKIIQCEVVCSSGYAIQSINQSGTNIHFCYIHDSAYGIDNTGSSDEKQIVSNCVIDTITNEGISLYQRSMIRECTIYSCGTGVQFTSQYNTLINTIIKDCTTGISSGQYNYEDNNCLHGNTTDRSGGVVAGPNSISSNPLLSDPANADFTLDATSPCFDAGIKLGPAVGL